VNLTKQTLTILLNSCNNNWQWNWPMDGCVDLHIKELQQCVFYMHGMWYWFMCCDFYHTLKVEWLIDFWWLMPLSAIMATSFSDGRSRNTQRETPTMGKQLVNFITCDWESSAPFFVIYKAGREPTSYWWQACTSCSVIQLPNSLSHPGPTLGRTFYFRRLIGYFQRIKRWAWLRSNIVLVIIRLYWQCAWKEILNINKLTKTAKKLNQNHLD
jgi:hypothetical protein